LIDPWEIIVIGGIIVALLVWGPQKIPELAESLGEAKRELETARRGEYDRRDSLEIPNHQRLTNPEERSD
jgi:TatA/E family protein of Tat protein translocase